jgi:hypothetical protein
MNNVSGKGAIELSVELAIGMKNQHRLYSNERLEALDLYELWA